MTSIVHFVGIDKDRDGLVSGEEDPRGSMLVSGCLTATIRQVLAHIW